MLEDADTLWFASNNGVYMADLQAKPFNHIHP